MEVEIRKSIVIIVLMMMAAGLYAQVPGNTRTKQVLPISDTLQLDSLSLVPGSFTLRKPNGELLDTSYYKLNYASGLLYLNRRKMQADSISPDSLKTEYRTFPFLFSEETKHKDAKRIRADLSAAANPFSYDIEGRNDDIFKMDGLNKSGSISRGITFGNNQDVVVNSNLNLQLSGHLSNNIDILMAATDNNIPVQPDGNTQQLQEFDKVFIQLSNANTKLIAGDFQMLRPAAYFMNFNKKAQGVNFSTNVKTNTEQQDPKKEGLYSTTISAAVSRGKFARNQIQGVESNQGPYRLRGAENEPFIIVLSGTERVYIDGRLMDRGQENDYVINYNTSEITFTPRQLITKDKRIVVEFQYSDKNYARSLVHFGNDYEQGKLKLHVNVYSEQDSKNQPLQQDLTIAQKKLLSRIGDTLSLAVTPSYDSVPFSNSEVLYQKQDTTIGTQTYPNVFVYSTSSDSAHYRVTFSNVGTGNGNYNQLSSGANGKVFQWIMPDTVTGKSRGSYEPVIQLVTPKKKQMLTVGAEYELNKNSRFSIEGAASNNDINTFSRANSEDDAGYALKLNFDNASPLKAATTGDSTKGPLLLLSNVNYEYVQKYFSPVERYRSVEFERDWNRRTTVQTDDQHIVGAAIGLSKKGTGAAVYRFSAFLEGNTYNATKHNANVNLASKHSRLFYDGSLLNSASSTNTNFYRHKSGISQGVKWLTVGLRDEFEQNKFALLKKDSLIANSYRFWEWEAYAQNADTTKNRYGINYKQRTDYAVKNDSGSTSLNRSAFAESYGGFFDLVQNTDNQLKVNAAYRRLQILDPALTVQKPDNTLLARVEYDVRLWKGLLYSSSYYEIGSGLEVKKEFSFIEVAAGQGVYTWIDYDSNGVKELNEFEVAVYADQATYIKVYTPTDKYIKTYTNQFSQSITLKPAVVWSAKKGFRQFMSRFANQASYRVDRKSTEEDLAKAYNPFFAETNDSTLVTLNSAFRNTLFINQSSSLFGLDITYQDVRNKSLLVNGFDTRSNIYKEGKFRWNITRQLSFNLEYKDGIKSSRSQFFPSRNYSIVYYEGTPKFNFQPNTAFRVSVSFRYTDKKNAADYGGQRAILQDYGAEIKYNVLNKGSLNLKGNFIQIAYNGAQNSSLSFEMLDALKPGQNITWGAAYQRTLSNNLQLSITYDGRKSEGTKAVHIGGAQVRAYF
ncbi:MAG: hypothetical protein JWO09_3472 [Bacteroidetes bacterium]|nr:hypothetical protein [Bacteroidota bacterium]